MSKLCFLGAGKMATAIAGGLVRTGTFQAAEIEAFDILPKAADAFRSATGCAAQSDDCAGAVSRGEALLLAVKPQMLADALTPLKGQLASKLVISIVAGVSIAKLKALTGSSRIVRVMPNTPALVGSGAAGYAPSAECRPEDVELAGRIFSSVGVAFSMPEGSLNAVTGLSGSGPAYVFEFIKALADGGVAEGLSHDVAQKLAIRTVLGSALLAEKSGLPLGVLTDMVTSPGGTTSRALETLAEYKFKAGVWKAVRAAAERSRELGEK